MSEFLKIPHCELCCEKGQGGVARANSAHLSSSKLCSIKYPYPSLSTVSLEWRFTYALDT